MTTLDKKGFADMAMTYDQKTAIAATLHRNAHVMRRAMVEAIIDTLEATTPRYQWMPLLIALDSAAVILAPTCNPLGIATHNRWHPAAGDAAAIAEDLTTNFADGARAALTLAWAAFQEHTNLPTRAALLKRLLFTPAPSC